MLKNPINFFWFVADMALKIVKNILIGQSEQNDRMQQFVLR